MFSGVAGGFSLPLVLFFVIIVGLGCYLIGYMIASKRGSDEN